MTRHPHDFRTPTPAVEKARARARERERLRREGKSGRVVSDASGTHVNIDVRVEELDEGTLEIKETLPQAWVSDLLDDGKAVRWRAGADCSVELALDLEGPFVRMKGEAIFRLVHPCVRCLNDTPFEVPLKVSLRLIEREPAPPEADLEHREPDGDDHAGSPLGDAADLEDLDLVAYQEGLIRVGDILREQLFLDLPMHPACDSPRAHPDKPCAYSDQQKLLQAEQSRWVDARWAGLAALRDKLAHTSPADAFAKDAIPLPSKKTPEKIPDKQPVPLPSRGPLARMAQDAPKTLESVLPVQVNLASSVRLPGQPSEKKEKSTIGPRLRAASAPKKAAKKAPKKAPKKAGSKKPKKR